MLRAAGTNGRYLPLAEIRDARQNVRFRGQSGHPLGLDECLLMTQLGHSIIQPPLVPVRLRAM